MNDATKPLGSASAAASDGRPPGREGAWLSMGERGTVFGIRAAFRLATLCGRTAVKPLVALIALWYALFDRKVARASRAWLLRVSGRPARFRDVYRHLRTFAQVTLDKVFLLTDHTRALRFTRTGNELLAAQHATGKGAILLGAHLGSYEAMRAGGDDDRIDIEILGYFANARMINQLLAELSPGSAARVIHLGEDPVGVMARVADGLASGHFIATMGDRTGLSDRVVRAPFFGEDAAFPAGPFLMAAVLRCPVYLVFGLYRAPNRYDLHCERFAERIELPRKNRDEALRAWVRRYAERVEHHARQAPENWFNFYDFWAPSPAAAAPAPAPTKPPEPTP